MRHIIAIILAQAINDRVKAHMTIFGIFQKKGVILSSQIGLFRRPYSVIS